MPVSAMKAAFKLPRAAYLMQNDNKITFFKKLIGVTTWNIVGTLYR